jgi:hypothetical protein
MKVTTPKEMALPTIKEQVAQAVADFEENISQEVKGENYYELALWEKSYPKEVMLEVMKIYREAGWGDVDWVGTSTNTILRLWVVPE